MKRKKNKKSGLKILLAIIGLVVLASAFAGFMFFGPNTSFSGSHRYLYIKTGAAYQQVLDSLREENLISNTSTFDFLAKRADYPAMVKPGKYRIDKGMSNYEIVRMLRSGRQEPVKLVVNKLRTEQDFLHLVSNQLEADTTILKKLMNDSTYLAQYGLVDNTAMCLVIPDTYEFWWNTSAEKTLNKLGNYYKKYWTNERKEKAASQGLDIPKVVTVASIVEEETNNNPEKPNIASVYLNRYKKGMKLQADPTVKFAVGDFSLRRITGTHTSFASPYNTYYTVGLPPGPICTPSKKSVDAVLNAPKTDYIFFCAKEDFSGTHRFAATYAEHMQNARRYQQALNARGIH